MELMAKVSGINTSDGIYNLSVFDKDNNGYHLKITTDKVLNIKLGHTYLFTCEQKANKDKNYYYVIAYKDILTLPFLQKDEALRMFYNKAPISLEYAIKEVNSYINRIENKIVKDITINLINEHYDEYYTYPAASKLHHAYIGGLCYHSIGMLHFADAFIENYNYLDKDFIYAGILLHDIAKTIELSGSVNTEYTLKGQLLGHLVMGAMEVERVALKLGYENSEEALMLEHMLISHHGQPQFGSAKKPMTPEALVLWYVDTIDSKFRVLGEELEKTNSKEFTDSIGVLDRSKIYKK